AGLPARLQDQVEGVLALHHGLALDLYALALGRGPAQMVEQGGAEIGVPRGTALRVVLVAHNEEPHRHPPGPVVHGRHGLSPAALEAIVRQRRARITGPGHSWGADCGFKRIEPEVR